MTRPGRHTRAATPFLPGAVLLSALLLTGCDIQSTDAIDAGDPATIQVFPSREDRTLLFFRSGGALMPIARPSAYETMPDLSNPSNPSDRPTTDAATAGTKTLVALLAGPLPAERAVGLSDGLPDLPDLPDLPGEGGRDRSPRVELTKDARTLATLPFALSSLDDLAVRQVICTVAFARDAEGGEPVVLRGTDGTLGPAGCDADIDLGVRPRPALRPDADSS
ncbi:hypothetical protein GCM10011583_45240 [Streptomyces camponoticapitis]|uniref:GerMN domain-containing protein n=1 Tax=Streptomyces camponoticapitis TaxID=1616125 RepID=A0ABQ2EEG6_9ACTN|nr:hypothetical protein [Streptomyces camponoticapitis]GGK08205.1 hypothetical protein GCM10011583_45240 [Streptomyces camponoticapitis]